jgi:hypothetical protein
MDRKHDPLKTAELRIYKEGPDPDNRILVARLVRCDGQVLCTLGAICHIMHDYALQKDWFRIIETIADRYMRERFGPSHYVARMVWPDAPTDN